MYRLCMQRSSQIVSNISTIHICIVSALGGKEYTIRRCKPPSPNDYQSEKTEDWCSRPESYLLSEAKVGFFSFNPVWNI